VHRFGIAVWAGIPQIPHLGKKEKKKGGKMRNSDRCDKKKKVMRGRKYLDSIVRSSGEHQLLIKLEAQKSTFMGVQHPLRSL
jgi:hypothetical protein